MPTTNATTQIPKNELNDRMNQGRNCAVGEFTPNPPPQGGGSFFVGGQYNEARLPPGRLAADFSL